MTLGPKGAWLAAGLTVGVQLIGCASSETRPETVYYRCADGARFGVTTLDSSKVELSRSGNRFTLNQVEAASGVKYGSSRATFWNKGDEALIEASGKTYTGCTVDSVQSSDEAVLQLQKAFSKGAIGGGGGASR
ncbi:MAG: MliC family protein [Burkholderiales bacterium]